MKANEIILLHFCNKKEERIYIVIFFTAFNSHKLFDKYCVLCAMRSLQLCLTLCDLWAIACWAPLSMRFSSREFWSGLLRPPVGDLPDSGTEPAFLMLTCIGRWVLYC